MANNIPPNRFPSNNPKLPYVGPNYQKYGDVPGYWYDYRTDKYYLNPLSQQESMQDQGAAKEPQKAPSTMQQIAPAALGVGAGALAAEAGKGIYSGISGGIKGLFGAGEAVDPATNPLIQSQVDSSLAANSADILGSTADASAYSTIPSGGSGIGGAGGGGAGLLGAGSSAAADSGSIIPSASSFGSDIPSTFSLAGEEGASAGSGLLGAGSEGAATAGTEAAEGAAAAGSDLGNYVVPGLGIALGSYGMYKNIKNNKSTSKGMGIASGASSGAAIGASVGSIVPGIGTAIGAAIGALIGGATGALSHVGTKASTNMNFGKLEKANAGNNAFVQLLENARELSLSKEDPDYHFSEKRKAGTLTADDVRNSYGVMKTFGPDWMRYTTEQQNNILNSLISNDMFHSKKGDIRIADPEEARKIAEQTVGALPSTAAPSPSPTTPAGGLLGAGSDSPQQIAYTGAPALKLPTMQQGQKVNNSDFSHDPSQLPSNVFLR